MGTKNSTEAANNSDQSRANMVPLGLVIGASAAAVLLVAAVLLLFWYRRSKGRWPCCKPVPTTTAAADDLPTTLAVKTVTEAAKQELHEQHKTALYEHDKLDALQQQIKAGQHRSASPLASSVKKKNCSRQVGTSGSSCTDENGLDATTTTNGYKEASKSSVGMENGSCDHVNFSDVTRNLRLNSSFKFADSLHDICEPASAAGKQQQQQQQRRSPGQPVAPRLRSKPSDTSDYVSDLDSCKPSRADTFSQVRENNYSGSSTVLSFQEVVRQLERSGRGVMQRQTSTSLVNVSRFCDYDEPLSSTTGHQHGVIFRPPTLSPLQHMYRHNIYERKYDSDGGANFVMYTQYNNRPSRYARKTKSEEMGLNVTPADRRNTKRRNNKTRRANLKKSSDGRSSSSVKLPISRTLIELPIYSQATWAGPGHKTRHNGRRQLLEWNQGSEPHLVALNHSLGIGSSSHSSYGLSENGPYMCAQYKSLPIDISHLPKELVDKIGGQADRLLEPIEQLDFAHLCRPLPHRVRPRESSKRLVTEKLCLPPGHRDLEVLSGTYEDQDTGLVSTDL